MTWRPQGETGLVPRAEQISMPYYVCDWRQKQPQTWGLGADYTLSKGLVNLLIDSPIYGFHSIFHHRNWRAKVSCDVDISKSAVSMVM